VKDPMKMGEKTEG